MISSKTGLVTGRFSRQLQIVLFFLCLLLKYNEGFTQTDLPKIIQPSPDAAALFKYQDYPMDYSTGLPQISIPIYEVKSGSLSVPISLSYHASGRKVSDQDGAIALGWSLNAGGMVSRTIYGSVDFGTNSGYYKFPYPFKTTNIDITTDLGYLEKINHFLNNPDECLQGQWMDSEYDVFSYSFGNNSGKFIFKDSNNVKTPVLLPYKPYIITPYADAAGLNNIDMVDDKGILYQFVAMERYSASSSNAVSGYALSKIISADKTDTVYFKYAVFTQERVSISQQIIVSDKKDLHTVGSPFDIPAVDKDNTQPPNREKYQISRITEIDFNQGKVVFNLVSGSDKIANVQVMNLNNQVIKTVEFNRTPCDGLAELGYATNNLSSIILKDSAAIGIEKYQFEYHPTISSNGQVNARYIDWWGYYNASGQYDMVPKYDIGFQEFPINPPDQTITIGNPTYNREPNLEALKSGVLKKITYPTGGSTEFIYENNKCTLYGNTNDIPRSGPGLRLYQTKTIENSNTPIIKTFKYGANESGYGAIELLPEMKNMSIESIYNYIGPNKGTTPDVGGTYRQRTFYSGFIPDLAILADRPVTYTEVTEYNGTETNNSGKTVYDYDYTPWGASNMPSFENLSIQRFHVYNYNYWSNSSLINQTVYKYKANSLTPYQKVKSTGNDYAVTVTDNITGLHLQKVHVAPQKERVLQYAKYPERALVDELIYQAVYPPIQIYTYSEYRIPAGYKNLLSTSDTIFNDNGSYVVTGTSYSYNNRQYVSKTTSSGSDNKSVITNIKYPFDYTGNSVLSQMVGLNMLNYPVEQSDLKNITPLKSVRTNYYNWGSASVPRIYQQSIDVQKGTNPYETRLSYYGYDNYGNPLNLSKDKDVHLSYIWDYNRCNPVAEVINADPGEIAYTSFEADGNGNWNGVNTANITNNAVGITGSKFYNLNATALSVSGLSTSQEYTVSYWSKNGSYAVNGTSKTGWPKNIRTVTINGVSWTCWEHRVTGVTTLTISGTGAIDELKVCPSDAQMKTYTYIPLIGLSTVNDFNNRISYYEYDAFGRLQLIKDMNGNVIKTMTYQYQSPAP